MKYKLWIVKFKIRRGSQTTVFRCEVIVYKLWLIHDIHLSWHRKMLSCLLWWHQHISVWNDTAVKQSYNHNCLFKDLCQWGHRTKHDSEKVVVNTPVVRIFISSEDGLSLQITWKCVKKAEEKAASTGKVTVENLNSYLQQWGEMNNKYRLEIAPNLDQKNIRNRILEEG